MILTIPLLLASHAAIPAASDPEVAIYRVSREPQLTQSAAWQLLRRRVKHVFVIYQENRSFDHYFGTFPGVDGLFSQPAAKTPGFYQPLLGPGGSKETIHPFRIGPKQYAADTSDVDHSHEAIVAKMDIQNGRPEMNRFAEAEETAHARKNGITLKDKQLGELTMAYVDGDTIPFLWRYANRFVLCDHIFQSVTGPSTPGNLAIFAGQTGATQEMLHPDEAPTAESHGVGVPVLGDPNPFWGSHEDKTRSGRMPSNPGDNPRYRPEIKLTFANIAYTLSGGALGTTVKSDRDPHGDLDDTRDDIAFISREMKQSVPWGWFEEGFDREPTDVKSSDPLDAGGLHASYVTHHNGPQYFGSISNNPKMSSHLHGLNDLYEAIRKRTLPSMGLFYVKGGFENLMGLRPACPDAKAQRDFVGDDDHPGYSDAQISEAMVARTVNAIADSPYWKDSVIFIAWDDSEGDYDHVPPPLETRGPDGSYISAGPRVPFLVVSPFARTHYVLHESGTQASVLKFVDHLFGLTPLADLPDELKGRKIGERRGLKNEGPQDDITAGIGDLLGAFDPARISGHAHPLPASYAEIPNNLVGVLPQRSGFGLKQLGIVPTDVAKGIKNAIPKDFNPRP